MIWFTCKQCGKTHGRSESSIGATIFCSCGVGLVVPWESTAAEPPEVPPLPEVAPVLKLEPVTFDAAPPQASPPVVRPRRRSRLARRNPDFCFNHEEIARQTACADCGEGFCTECVVTFAGATLCGPCKNFRVKNLQRPVPASNLSILSVLIAFLTGPVTVGLLLNSHPSFPWGSVMALLPQGLAAALAIVAVRQTEKDPKIGGRSLALTGLFSAGVTTVLVALLTLYRPHLWM